MNRITRSAAFAVLALLTACASATFTQGREFSTDNIGKIVKGQTTDAQMLQLFGPPYSRTVLADGTESWLYTYTLGESTAHVYLFYSSVHTTGTQKVLNVTLNKGLVTNFSYTEGAAPGSN